MRKLVSLILAGSFVFVTGCGLLGGEPGSSSKATGPSAPIILICNEDKAATSGVTNTTSNNNNCDRSTKTGEPVEE